MSTSNEDTKNVKMKHHIVIDTNNEKMAMEIYGVVDKYAKS